MFFQWGFNGFLMLFQWISNAFSMGFQWDPISPRGEIHPGLQPSPLPMVFQCFLMLFQCFFNGFSMGSDLPTWGDPVQSPHVGPAFTREGSDRPATFEGCFLSRSAQPGSSQMGTSQVPIWEVRLRGPAPGARGQRSGPPPTLLTSIDIEFGLLNGSCRKWTRKMERKNRSPVCLCN